MAKIKKKTKDKGKRSFIVWMTVIGVLLVGSYAGVLGWKSRPPKGVGARHALPLQKNMTSIVDDPVCGMKVKPPAVGHVEYRAKHYYFCSHVCKEEFEKDPGKYLHHKDTKGTKNKDMKEM